jgi:mannosyltransferase
MLGHVRLAPHRPTPADLAALSALAAMLCAATLLRVRGLTREGLWLDEAFSVRLASGSLLELFRETALDVHPPLYYLVLQAWVTLFGPAEWSVRMPSVLVGITVVVAVYRLGSLLFDRRAGSLAALLVALSVYHVQYAQEARMYVLLALLSVLSTDALVRWRLAEGRRGALGYVLTTTLLLYTHLYGLFVVLAQQGFALASIRGSSSTAITARAWLRLQGLVALLFAPWAVVTAMQVLRVRSEFWIPPPSWTSLGQTFAVYAGSFELLVVLAALAAGGFVAPHLSADAARPHRDPESPRLPGTERAVLLASWLALPILVPFALSFVVAAIFLPRYTIASSVAFYLLVAAGVRRLHPWGVAAAAVLIVALSMSVLERWYDTPYKEQWREAARFVEARAQPGDLVLFNASYLLTDAFGYYARRSDLSKHVLDAEVAGRLSPDELRDYALRGRDRLWAVVSRDNPSARLLRHCLPELLHVRERHRWIGVEVLLFEARARRPGEADDLRVRGRCSPGAARAGRRGRGSPTRPAQAAESDHACTRQAPNSG